MSYDGVRMFNGKIEELNMKFATLSAQLTVHFFHTIAFLLILIVEYWRL